MLVSNVSLFNSYPRNYQNKNVNKLGISFGVTTKKPRAVDVLIERVNRGQLSDSTRELVDDYQRLVREGKVRKEGDTPLPTRRPGEPEEP